MKSTPKKKIVRKGWAVLDGQKIESLWPINQLSIYKTKRATGKKQVRVTITYEV